MAFSNIDVEQPHGMLRSLDIRQAYRGLSQISGLVTGCEQNPEGVLLFDVAGVINGLHSDIEGDEVFLHIASDEGPHSLTKIRFEGTIPRDLKITTRDFFEVKFLSGDTLPAQRPIDIIAKALWQAVNMPMGIDTDQMIIRNYRNNILATECTLQFIDGLILPD